MEKINHFELFSMEIKRRTKVLGVFPDQPAVLRLMGTLPIEIDDDWITIQRRYFTTESNQMLIDYKRLHKKETSDFLVELTATVCSEA